MHSEVVLNGNRDRAQRGQLNPLRLLRRLFTDRDSVDGDYDPGAAKMRLLGRALTRREQEAYARAVDTEREIQQSALQSTRESLAATERNCQAASGLILDSGVREASRLGRIFYETRARTNTARLVAVTK